MTTKTWRIEPDALLEAGDAAAHYESERAGLGDDFTAALDAAFVALEHTPRVGSVERVGKYEVRRSMLDGFPYAVIFVELGDEFVVVAITYAGRDPRHWKKRMRALR